MSSEPASPGAIIVRGGGTIWVDGWRMSVSKLLVTINLTATGVEVQFPADSFWRWTLQTQTGDHRLVDDDLRWTCSWDQFDHVIAAPGSMVIVRKDGAHCRFKSMHHKGLRAIRAELLRHGVEVRRVRTTVFHYLMSNVKRGT